MEKLKRILVVSRSTKHCRKAVHYGVLLAKINNAELYILHVVHDPFTIEGWNFPIRSFYSDLERMKEEAKKEIDQIIQVEQSAGLRIKEWVTEGHPVEAVLEKIKDYGIDLIIMQAHQEGRLEHLIFGPTNEQLVRTMPCSILLVKGDSDG